MSIMVARDSEGLVIAAKELFKHSLGDKKLERTLKELTLEQCDEATVAKLAPRRSLSPGYYENVLYLIWLDQALTAGVPLNDLTADEADGLIALKRARVEFEDEFPPCSDCGVRNSQGSKHLCPVRQQRNMGRH